MVERYVDSGRAGPVGQFVDAVASVSRYDLILAVIPMLLLTAAITGAFADVPLGAALAVASVLASLFVADALFVNPPEA